MICGPSSKEFTLNARLDVQELDMHQLKEITGLPETKRQRGTINSYPETTQAQHI